MIGDVDRRLGKLDVLDRFKLTGRSEAPALDLLIGDLVVEGLIDAMFWQWLAQLSAVSWLTTTPWFLRSARLLFLPSTMMS